MVSKFQTKFSRRKAGQLTSAPDLWSESCTYGSLRSVMRRKTAPLLLGSSGKKPLRGEPRSWLEELAKGRVWDCRKAWGRLRAFFSLSLSLSLSLRSFSSLPLRFSPFRKPPQAQDAQAKATPMLKDKDDKKARKGQGRQLKAEVLL